DARPARRAEGSELRVAELQAARGAEKFLVARVRSGPPTLDVVDAEVVEALDHAHLVVEREGDVLRLRAVAQGGVVGLDLSLCGHVMKASCSARTASSVYFSSMTTEILISEVEIIWMLIPSRASTSNIRDATPACVRMPMPTIEIFAMSSSPTTPRAPISRAVGSTTWRAFE